MFQTKTQGAGNAFTAPGEQNGVNCSVIVCVLCPGRWTNKGKTWDGLPLTAKSNLTLLNWMSPFKGFGLQPRLYSPLSPFMFPCLSASSRLLLSRLCATHPSQTARCFLSPVLSSFFLLARSPSQHLPVLCVSPSQWYLVLPIYFRFPSLAISLGFN